MDSNTRRPTSGPEDDGISSQEKNQGMHQVWTLTFSLAILQVGFGIVTPIFPYYVIDLGARAIDLGMLAASFALTRILLAGPLGGLSDNVGRKTVLMYSLVGFAISNVIYASAETIIVMIAARALEGAVSAGFYPAANAYVSDVTTPENRGTAMGYISMGNMVGFVVGPTVGGILAQFLGIRIPFLVAALGAIGTLIAVMLLVQEPPRVSIEPAGNQISRPPLLEVLQKESKAYTALGISMFSNMFAIGILEVAFTLEIVETYGISPLEIGLFFGVLGIVTIIGNILFGKMSDRLGRKWLIVVGSFIGALSMYIFMIATNLPGFFLGGVVLGIAMSMRGPTIQALTADLTDQRSYGIIMGMMGAVSNSAYVVGPLLGGFLYDKNGNSYEALAAAVIVSCMGGVGAIAGLPNKIRRSAVRPESLDEPD